jgi:hypothetical protein
LALIVGSFETIIWGCLVVSDWDRIILQLRLLSVQNFKLTLHQRMLHLFEVVLEIVQRI